MFSHASAEIDALLSHLGPQQIEKIDWAYENLKAGDAESIAAAMNSVRRLIDEFADAVFPATDAVRTGADGKPINLGNQNRLNRVKAYIDDSSVSSTRKQRVKRSIGDLYGRVCAGLHKEVSSNEAEYLFLSAYVVLGEILTLASDSALEPADVDIE
ncbi:hypothetical protein EEB14_20780 [Rhodococcus sp. WS4]|nr:hypothetical protein EEB14_20780 [Rhodococcus sp. WS4]